MAPQGDSTNAKQLIVGRIQQATNILVAVSANPSIDALSASLALALMLNKLDKHATAVFSGQVPSVMQFLNPEKTFENNVDSLRDFIISLDKEKADRLRYKLEKDVVRIFITPYRTTISEKDLQFSQGDFNVDLVIALGVEKREDLDQAIIAHGRILHDATVVTINANSQQSSLGAVDWNDANSSSLCEMLMSLTEALQKPGLLDAQIANALLTGIVAATDRFSNQHTTPRVMTMAAQLMAAGANQQLVSVNMQKTDMTVPQPASQDDQPAEAGKDGTLSIVHADEPKEEDDKAAGEPKDESKPTEDTTKAEAELDAALPKPAEPAPDMDKSLDDLKAQLEEATKEEAAKPAEPAPEQPVSSPEQEPAEPAPEPEVGRKFVSDPPNAHPSLGNHDESGPQIKDEKSTNSWRGHRIEPPTMGGSLSSTSEQALEDKQHLEEDERNRKILTHDGQTGDLNQAIPPMPEGLVEDTKPAPAPDGDALAQDALKDAHSAIDSQPYDPAGKPRQDLGTQPLSGQPAVQPYIPIEPPSPAPPPAPQPSAPQTDVNGLPVIPPMPALPTEDPNGPPNLPPMPPPLPPLPGEQPPAAPPAPGADPSQSQPSDPGQFKIPGQ